MIKQLVDVISNLIENDEKLSGIEDIKKLLHQKQQLIRRGRAIDD